MANKRQSALVLLILGGLALPQPSAADDRGNVFDEMAREALSAIEGRLEIAGLRAPVDIIRDELGVPHIYAANLHDLFFAQGYVIAQDRLWQLEMIRHVAQGRVSELIGDAGLPHDRLVRTLRFRGPFDDAEWTNYHPQARQILASYAQGINAFILQAGDNLPVEFRLTGLRPRLWQAQEILARARVTAALNSAQEELLLAQQVAKLGAKEANRVANPDPYGELVAHEGVDYALITDEVIAALDGRFTDNFPRPELLPAYEGLRMAWQNFDRGAHERSPGSNNWAVAGARTRSGSAIMVDDPHRQVTLPAWRYVIHLNAPGWDVAGATEPGLPGVIRGHNGHVAWGRTATGTDEADVYVETVNPDNPNEFLWRGDWEPVRTETEVIEIRGRKPEYLQVRLGRHGPVFHQSEEHHVAYALRSSLQERGTAEYIGALRLNQATTAHDCLDMGTYVKSPPTNLVCADSTGNIAFQVTAAAPDRPNWDGRLPVPGTGDYEWRGLRPSHDLPREYNPDRNYIATANNNIHPPGWERPLFFNKQPPYWRVDRISEMIESGSDYVPEDFVAMLRDNYRGAAAEWQPSFAGWRSGDPSVEAARKTMVDWNGLMTRDSAGAAIFHLWIEEVDADAIRNASPSRARAMVRKGLETVVELLSESQAPDASSWHYGPLHTSVFAHPLASAYDLPGVERDGGYETVNATGSVYRLITDFSDLDNSLFTLAPGQSGQPGSPHYGDLLEDWSDGRFFSLHFSRQAVEKHARHRLALMPAQP
jgi:penicillin amidase